ncbi:MAG: hypothetical protein PHE29_14955 [Tissierellia bacterium]|nr:hypothetical protein [Tissierellia bacterium]
MKYDKFKLYWYLCISAFFLILIITLLYSFGYKYDIFTGKSTRTGAIVLQMTPKDAAVTKDGEIVEKSGLLNGLLTDFVKIEDLEAKTYNIKVTKNGYNEWWKNVEINAGQVNKFENIVLLKQNYTSQRKFESVEFSDISKVWISKEKNKIAYYGIVDNQEGLFVIDLESEKVNWILDKQRIALMGIIKKIRWTEDGNKIIVETVSSEKEKTSMYVVDLSDQKAYSINDEVSQVLSQSPDGELCISDKYLAFAQNNSINLFNYENKEIIKIIDGVDNFFLEQNNIYFFKPSSTASLSTLFYINLDNVSREVKIADMPADYDKTAGFMIKRESGNIIVLSNNSLYFIDKDAKTKKINSNIKEASFFQNGKRIIYFNDNEIWIYYTEDKFTQPIKSKGDNELLTRFSGNISNICLYLDNEHILFQENNTFKFTELDSRNNRNTYNILENANNMGIFYLRGKNYIYYIRENKIFRINLEEE